MEDANVLKDISKILHQKFASNVCTLVKLAHPLQLAKLVVQGLIGKCFLGGAFVK